MLSRPCENGPRAKPSPAVSEQPYPPQIHAGYIGRVLRDPSGTTPVGGGRKLRSLTDTEANVIATLLAARPERERERLRQIGVARSTYYAVRRRAYVEGWLQDRYIPDPSRLGRPYATFVLSRPFADRVSDLGRPVGKCGPPTVLWSNPQLALGVFFHARPEDGSTVIKGWEEGRITASNVGVTVDVRGPTVPVYFDFEGLWDHLTGAPGTLSYPHGIGGVPEEEGPVPLTPHSIWAFGNLLNRPFRERERGEDGHQLGVFGLPFSERRLLARGWVTHRVLLNPSRIPPYLGRSLGRVFLIVGTARPEAKPDVLFARLTRECRVFPFLYVASPDRWLIGGLGGEPAPGAAGDDRHERAPVLPTIRESLEAIQIFQEPASTLSMSIDHRYDQLVPSRPSSSR